MQAFFSPGDDCRKIIEETILYAARSIRICVFTISDNRLADTILRAHRDGLDIQIISDNEKAFDKGSDIIDLARAGLDVRVDVSPNHMHHKFLVVDEETVLTGSYNWTRSAEHYNNENLVRIDDQELARAFLDEFNKIYCSCQSALEL